MPLHGFRNWKRMLTGASLASVMMAASAASVHAQDTSPAADTVPLQPSLIDFLTGSPVSAKLQDLAKPKLLRKAFAGLPKKDPKGLAAIIKGKEVDVPNRVDAANYLGRVDCQQFPESQLALKDLLLDEFEPVRFEAAKALSRQFSKGPKDPSGFQWAGVDCICNLLNSDSKRKDACRGCCNTENIQDVIDVMHKQAYGCDETGCPNEPSIRVREELASAIKLCVHCECSYENPTYAEPLEPHVEPIPRQDGGEGTAPGVPPTGAAPGEGAVPAPEKPSLPAPADGEAASASTGFPLSADSLASLDSLSNESLIPPAPTGDLATAGLSQVSFETQQSAAASEIQTLGYLQGNCPVTLVDQRSCVPASDQYVTTVDGMFGRYEVKFASQEALETFLASPEKYFPVLDGYCVTTWLKTGLKVKGQMIAKYQGRCYCFGIKALANEFSENPEAVLEQLNAKLAESDQR